MDLVVPLDDFQVFQPLVEGLHLVSCVGVVLVQGQGDRAEAERQHQECFSQFSGIHGHDLLLLLAALRATERALAGPFAVIEPIDGYVRVACLAGRLVKRTLDCEI